jgi:hypothetical protein
MPDDASLNVVVCPSFVRVLETSSARYAFMAIPIGLTLTGALITGSEAGMVLVGAGGLVNLARFWRFDRKPVIEAGDLDAVAMIHDAREELPLH